MSMETLSYGAKRKDDGKPVSFGTVGAHGAMAPDKAGLGDAQRQVDAAAQAAQRWKKMEELEQRKNALLEHLKIHSSEKYQELVTALQKRKNALEIGGPVTNMESLEELLNRLTPPVMHVSGMESVPLSEQKPKQNEHRPSSETAS